MPPLLSEVPFGSFLVYSPRGTSEVSKKSRLVRDRVKSSTRQFMKESGAPRLLEELSGSPLETLFSPGAVLVPMPRRFPLKDAAARWPGREVAEELVAVGIGSEVRTLLERVEAVPKSAFAAPGERPTVLRHYETMRASSGTVVPEKIVIVDDVITKGSTLLGAATRVKEAYPTSEVVGFSVLRTLGLQPEVVEILDPVTGIVSLSGDSGWRKP